MARLLKNVTAGDTTTVRASFIVSEADFTEFHFYFALSLMFSYVKRLALSLREDKAAVLEGFWKMRLSVPAAYPILEPTDFKVLVES